MDMDKYIGRLLDNRYEILEVIGVGGMVLFPVLLLLLKQLSDAGVIHIWK